MQDVAFVDSTFTLEEALAGTTAPQNILESLALIEVRYMGFDDHVHQGQLVVHTDVAVELVEIFEELLAAHFPIRSVIPIAAHSWNDDASMAVNNSSAFNYRTIAGTDRLSNHSRGLAIDINPLLNPYTQYDGTTVPAGAIYNPLVPGTILAEGPVARAFLSRGWHWGGHWQDVKDYQHFEKLPRVTMLS